MEKLRCKWHPRAEMIPAGKTQNEGRLFICARCSNMVIEHHGVIDGIDMRKATGQIVVPGSGSTKRYLFSLGDVSAFRPQRGQRVLFESGLTSTRNNDYVHAGKNVKLIT